MENYVIAKSVDLDEYSFMTMQTWAENDPEEHVRVDSENKEMIIQVVFDSSSSDAAMNSFRNYVIEDRIGKN